MSLSSLLLAGKGAQLTSFFSPLYFLGFLPICLILYSLTPNKLKRYFLLAASYAFFWLISGELIVYLLLSTVSIHYFGLWLDRIQSLPPPADAGKDERKAFKNQLISRQRAVILFAVLVHIGILLTLKYSGFFAGNINQLFSRLGIGLQLAVPRYLIPIGISFFTPQALSYIIDVYRGVTKADINIFRLALFMGFFPQIVEGPICRYHQTADQLWNVKPISHANLTLGAERILFGMMKKVVIADRLNTLVKNVFSSYSQYDGGIIAVAAVCYTVQLYMDFSGSIDAVIGTSQMLGIGMPENFERPFFSRTISEFWKRWHITLGTWFKDYVFYPVTTSKRMKSLTSSARKKIGNHYGPLLAGGAALFCVWLANGLWHGSEWKYIFFGLYHFVMILGGSLISPVVKLTNRALRINSEGRFYRLLQVLRTGVIVVIGELFFRANNLGAGLTMFRMMVTRFTFPAINAEFLAKLGVDWFDLAVVLAALIIVFIVSRLNERGLSVRKWLAERNIAVRWSILYALIIFIVVFGAYGFGYQPIDPLYAQF